MEKNKKYTLATTEIDGFTYEDFVEYWKEINNIPDIPNRESEEFKGWCEVNDSDDYDEFVEDWCEDEDIEEIPSENSQEYWDWCYGERDENWECDMDNIKYCNEYNVPCVITGKLGLWDGRHEIVPVIEDNIYEAIMKCCQGSGCYNDYEIFWINGVIEVYHHHHDGTNIFEIHPLSKKGISKWKTAEKNYEDVVIKPWDIKKIPYLYEIIS